MNKKVQMGELLKGIVAVVTESGQGIGRGAERELYKYGITCNAFSLFNEIPRVLRRFLQGSPLFLHG